ncbi:MAG: efflux RND transporter periplasmic adaptor subunit, partial [Mesorhizobium sp.]
MKKRNLVVLAGVLVAASGAAAFAMLAVPTQEAAAVGDPRQE